MRLTPGTRLGPYDIVAPLGVGGMGEVYRATDANLKRSVAIKTLPATVAADEERLARFLREAQVLASLNDPHIAQIYGLEKTDDVTAIVMELVEGPTLADRIADGPLPLDEALPIAQQIAEALEAAHEQGVIHRDLKPANIKVRPDGTVKVLDFGLAKAIEPVASRGDVSQSPTITSPAMTQAGIVLGTAAYMSPEQAKGRPADKRSDMWAFGSVLYEMLSGAKPFDGEDTTDVLGAVVRLEPDWTKLPASAPAPVRELIQACLIKDRRQRVADVSTALFVLRRAGATAAMTTTAAVSGPPASEPRQYAVPRSRRRWIAFAPAFVGLAIGVSFAAAGVSRLWRSPGRSEVKDVVRASIATPPEAPFWSGRYAGIAVAPSGRVFVYRSNTSQGTPTGSRLVLRDLANADVTPFADIQTVAGPFMSPDGEWVGYQTLSDNTLRRVPVRGGASQVICQADGQLRGASWASDGTVVYATDTSHGLFRVPAAGGTPQRLTTASEQEGPVAHALPSVLPGAKAAVFVVDDGFTGARHLAVVRLDDGTVEDLGLSGTSPQFVEPDLLVYALNDRIQAVRFDPRTLRVRGTPTALAESVGTHDNGAAQFAVGGNGTLIHVTGPVMTRPGNRTLVWVDREGREQPIDAPAKPYTYAYLSPDATRVALDSRDAESDIWIWNLERHTMLRLTRNPGPDTGPTWMPDNSRIAYSSTVGGSRQIYWQRADGSDEPRALGDDRAARSPQTFTPDGKRLLFSTPIGTPFDIGVLTVDGSEPPRLLLHSSDSETNPALSPDGKWMAYEATTSGRAEIYVRPFPNLEGSLQPVSSDGGTRPLWSRDGKELFYYRAPGTIMSVAVSYGPGNVTFGAPKIAIKGSFAEPVNAGRHYDVSPDGRRFLMMKQAADTPALEWPRINVVLNFTDELRRLVP